MAYALDMFRRRFWCVLLALCAFIAVFAGGSVAAQESLGDIARRIRGAKGEDGTPADKAAAKSRQASTRQTPANLDLAAIRNLLSERDEEAYATRVRTQLEQENFKVLDDVAAAERSGKTRFPGGAWKLHALYYAVETPREKPPTTEAEWADTLDRLKRWKAQQPDSITAQVALGYGYLKYAWQARGEGDAASVTPEGKRLFTERVQLAENELLGADARCPEWYYVMLQLERAKGMEAEDLTSFLEKAAAYEPEFYYSYQEVALGLMPKSSGKEGDVEKFAEEAANKAGGKAGDILYWLIVQSIMSNREVGNIPQHLSWSRALLGYQALVAQYGMSLLRQNQLAQMAARFGDYMVTDETISQIGDHWDPGTWGSKEYFEKIKSWASASAVPFRKIIDAYKAVNANVATPEGQRYDSVIAREFSNRYARVVKDCNATASGPAPTLLILQMSRSGAVQQMMVVPENASDTCLRPKLEKAAFTPPPKPEYWVRVSLPSNP
jgi:cell pole-organizing protein PopZ